jgi:hypothetical protein
MKPMKNYILYVVYLLLVSSSPVKTPGGGILTRM